MSDWDFAENERDQLRRWAQLNYAQRLQWLWEAKLFARRAQDAATRRATASGSDDGPESIEAAEGNS